MESRIDYRRRPYSFPPEKAYTPRYELVPAPVPGPLFFPAPHNTAHRLQTEEARPAIYDPVYGLFKYFRAVSARDVFGPLSMAAL